MEQSEIDAATKVRNTLSFLMFLLWFGAASFFVFVVFAILGTMTLKIFFGGLLGFVIYFVTIARMHDKIFLKCNLADVYINHNINGEMYKQKMESQIESDRVKRKNAHTATHSAMICPHCQTKGSVSTTDVKRKKGISGAKATGAILTGGISLLATGLSRKEDMTQAHCQNCNCTWEF